MIKPSREFKILVDLDDTLIATNKTLSKWAYELYGLGEPNKRYTEKFDLIDYIPGLTEYKMDTIFNMPQFWQEIPLFHGAKEFMKELGLLYNVHIVTDRRFYNDLALETVAYLIDNNITFNEVKIIKGTEKWEYARDNDIDFVIENNYKNAISLADVCPVVLVEWPYTYDKWGLTRIPNNSITILDNYSSILTHIKTNLNYFEQSTRKISSQ